ncbi:MAG: hypothetical protein PHP69_00095 [Candidatus Omnitrophica bacterium]|nr:hypothetical protein [Candidatus Omnitrophota bacterium]MDD5081451.1 hypothetical protein [Candidatus Omnitrophota bacterium]MDD5440817.1 hypothetical protein [Candidatus Omnitrophota bacterium]
MTLYILIFLGIIFFSIGIILVLKNVFLVSHYKNQALSLKKKYDETLHEINDQQTRIKNDFKDSNKKIAELSKKLQETTAEKDVQISKLENELAKKQTTSTDNAPAHNDHEIKTLRETLSEKYEIIKQLNQEILSFKKNMSESPKNSDNANTLKNELTFSHEEVKKLKIQIIDLETKLSATEQALSFANNQLKCFSENEPDNTEDILKSKPIIMSAPASTEKTIPAENLNGPTPSAGQTDKDNEKKSLLSILDNEKKKEKEENEK